ncbi:imidazoleglycerol-phosphate dehydratase HisB [Cerasicoccus arenae]|uniref:Imidazoleglycerol-phosphate dehydratase n=1 Tax=Cerasicoccus arenae TaxID=424488 RepID=A0A8J3GE18_9BACT|nr:imidazoleglycerol-phosphate dehydratase HisB [Cerasicoccus arenae]MBK1859401.1 imidazoleglycerol-phosphate dehydratase HisB [Cerasicoccus arenae]GHC10780.1 imidazoleglycerol-phosphate dehydratase [Cerasicoccus arenae]
MAEEVENNARSAAITRETKETQITLSLNIDGTGQSSIDTGIPFFDHMLDLFARHGLFDLEVKATGDLDVDYHHTVEDVGIVLGEAVKQAIGNKRGMKRYGFFILPMDECLAQVVIDLSNRPIFRYKVEAANVMIRDFNIALVKEFFQAFTNAVGANLHMKLEYGEEPHHIAESLFKCFGRALDVSTQIDPRMGDRLPSTKEAL